jgi:hypothetical protein
MAAVPADDFPHLLPDISIPRLPEHYDAGPGASTALLFRNIPRLIRIRRNAGAMLGGQTAPQGLTARKSQT